MLKLILGINGQLVLKKVITGYMMTVMVTSNYRFRYKDGKDYAFVNPIEGGQSFLNDNVKVLLQVSLIQGSLN